MPPILLFFLSLIPYTLSKLKSALLSKHSLNPYSHFTCLITITLTLGNILVIDICIMIHHPSLITSISSSVSHPFILIILSCLHNLCSVTFNLFLSFYILQIHFLYPLMGFPSSSAALHEK